MLEVFELENVYSLTGPRFKVSYTNPKERWFTMEIVYDGHIHMPFDPSIPEVSPQKFAEKASEAGIGGGLIISPPPPAQYYSGMDFRERISKVLDYCHPLKNYYPAYWIDPTEKDAVQQVAYAKTVGIRALKIICSKHHPAAGLECYRMAAALDLPILFHSGSLWDGEVSADFNRPSNWECMLDVYNTRFCLAHISWPWQSECMALFGKLKQANFLRKDRKTDMYIDCSPGTPEIDREDIFRRFGLLGYDLSDRLIWGVDSSVHQYSVDYAKWIYKWDQNMFAKLQKDWGDWEGFRCEGSFMSAQNQKRDFNRVFQNATKKNLLRFIGEKV